MQVQPDTEFPDKMTTFRLGTKFSEYSNEYIYDDVYIVRVYNNDLDFNILEDDVITIEGSLWGMKSYNSLSGKVTYPSILIHQFELIDEQ